MLPLKKIYQVTEYIRANNSSPFGDWFNTLDAVPAARIAIALLRMENGNLANVKWFHGIGEYRLDTGPGYRIYFGRDKEQLILLNGGTKRQQSHDIEKACNLWTEYKLRKSS